MSILEQVRKVDHICVPDKEKADKSLMPIDEFVDLFHSMFARYYVDNNGNKWSVDEYTLEEAREMSKKLSKESGQ